MKKLLCILFLGLSSMLSAQKMLIDAAFAWDDINWFFIKGNKVVKFDKLNNKVLKIMTISEAFPGISFSKVDAVLDYNNGKIYFFSGDQYMRFDRATQKADAGFPRITGDGWNTLLYNRFDAAISYSNGKSYFFKGSEYIRYDRNKENTDEGYPKSLNSSTWPGVTFSNVDAALVGAGQSKLYFFYGDEFIRFDIATDKAEEGYPQKITAFKGLKEALGGASPNPSPNPQPNPISNTKYGKYKVSKTSIDISAHPIQSPNKVVADYMLRKGVKDQMIVAYQKKHDVIILKMNSEGAQIGNPIVINGYWISDYYPMEDGSIVALLGKSVNNTYLGEYPNTLYFVTIAANGAVGTPKHIFGGDGHGAGKSWFDGRSSATMAFNGTTFGLYFEVQKNWAEAGSADDIHNGDMFIQTDKQGNKIEKTKHFWTASHSNTLQVDVAPNKEYWTMTIGDANPYGLQVYNRDQNTDFIAWPPKEDWISYEECQSSSAAGILHFMDFVGEDLLAIMGTLDHPNIGWDTKVDPLFLKFDKSGKTLTKKYLVQTPDVSESVVSVFPTGNNYLVAFGEGNSYEKDYVAQPFQFCVVDKNGNFAFAPSQVDYPFASDSELVPASEKVFFWLNADNGENSIEVYKLEFE